MKKIFFTLLIFTLPSLLIAKKSSQLVFNRTASFSLRLSGYSSYFKPDSSMVWKIESILQSPYNDTYFMELNGIEFRPSLQRVTNGEGPIWIGENDSIRFRGGGSYADNILVSMLEFQIIK
tara:strand:- start:651 stop:1013 length:363 start_codon:yes stop_codon:yes gene_type:complete